MKSKHIIFFWLALAISLSAFAQTKTKLYGDVYTKAHPAEEFSIKSKFAKDREYKMYVTYAIDSLVAGKKYPVLFYTDGWYAVDFFNVMSGWLRVPKVIEPVILVGISFEANDDTWLNVRGNDFLPNINNPDTANGAKNFLSFIKQELIPYVEKNYPVDSTDRGLYGYSYGGLFATWVLREEPLLFKRMGIGSPSLWYQKFALLKDKQLLDNIKNANNLKVFVEYGTSESETQKSGAEQLFELFNANKNIQSTKFILDGAHFSAYPATCMKALSYLYEKQK